MLIPGSCHCGNIAFNLDWQPEPVEIPARACSCSFCIKHGGVWTSCPNGDLVLEIRDASRLSRYAFGTKTAEFLICTICGAVPVVTCEIDSQTYAVVNVNTMEGVDPALLKRTSVSFDAEDEAARLKRRAKNWIPIVRFAPA